MDVVQIVLRLIHIAAGVFWVGATFAFFLFMRPSAKAIGPDGEGAFMDQLMRVRNFPRAMSIATGLTVAAGALLYWRASGGLNDAWLTSGTGIGFSIGALAAIVSFLVGPIVLGPTVDKLGKIGGRLKEERRPPTAEEGATLMALDERLTRIGAIDLVLLGVAVFFMAISRYLG